MEIPPTGNSRLLMVQPTTDIQTPGDLNHPEFEELYIAMRKKENRLYTDEEVLQLPLISADHPHSKEWRIRSKSTKRIIAHLSRKQKPLHLLEIGCGNGWLSARIAELQGIKVTAIDINETEILQAKRVFRNHTNVEYEYATIDELQKRDLKFDCIIFAASLQYFSDLTVLKTALSILRFNGEIHIFDTSFYTDNKEAILRSKEYFSQLGFPEMAEYYFHHNYDALKAFNYTMRYDPTSFANKLFSKNPFPWILITPIC